jgi:hypothetical protein
LGELLDQTFSYFRKHFWLFAGIMVLPEGLLIALNIIIQVSMSGVELPKNPQTPQAAAQSMAYYVHLGLASFSIIIPYYLVYAMALGATAYALSEIHLGRTTTIRESYRVVRRKLGRLLNVIFSILLRSVGIFMLATFLIFTLTVLAIAPIPKSMTWLIAIVGLLAILGFIISGILVIIFLMRYSVAVPALVLENLSARQAIKRSVALTKGYLWRFLVVGLLMTIIRAVLVILCQSPFTIASIVISVKGGRPSLWLTIPSLLVGGVGATATAPLLMISFAIAYYDLRVRKEGFDLQLMMSHLDGAASPDVLTPAQTKVGNCWEDTSVFGIIIWSIISGGIYQPIWFLRRRKALNSLHSSEKVGVGGLIVALIGFVASVCIPTAGSFIWGSSVQAENALGPIHPLILSISGIIMVVQCFKVRRIMLDHLMPRDEGMFAASIRFQYDDLLSRMGTFFLGIYYLQYKINGLLDRLMPEQETQVELIPPVLAESPLPQNNS